MVNAGALTMKDVLNNVRSELGAILIPGDRIESIGIPIARAMNGINACIQAIERNEQEEAERARQAAEQAAMEEPEEPEELLQEEQGEPDA